LLNDGYIYLSINSSGYVQRIKLDKFMEAAKHMTNEHGRIDGWENCKVGAGARTIEISPSGKYIFAACNNASRLCVVDTRTMQMIAEIPVDSYPVGLDISNDGRYVLVTSQGRKNGGGNAVNIYQIDYPEPEPVKKEPAAADSDSIAAPAADNGSSISQSSIMKWLSTTTGQVTAGAIAAVLIAAVAVPVSMKRRRK
jgi:YVTN family beta-propeller protein